LKRSLFKSLSLSTLISAINILLYTYSPEPTLLNVYGNNYKDNQNDNNQLKAYKGFNFDDVDDNSNEPFNFAAVGDFGCSEKAKETVTNIASKEPELVLTLGDLSYNATAGCSFNVLSSLKHRVMITLGYHDVINRSIMDVYLSFEFDKPYYSFDYRKVHFLVMASEFPFDKGSEQYKFVKQDLKEASENEDVNWIIASTYGPLYTSPSRHKPYEPLRDLYHPLFDKYRVDLVLQAHNHNYQRTHPMMFNPDNSSKPVISNASSSTYIEHRGIIFATVGMGGKSIHHLYGKDPYISTQFNSFGFLNIEINNSNSNETLSGSFFDNKRNEIKDYFTIKKKIK
jgi:Calcineurin-like phosphoesterase